MRQTYTSRAKSWLALRYNQYLLLAAAILLINCLTAFTWAVPRVISPDTASSWAVDTIAPVPPLTEAYHRFTRTGTEFLVYPLFHYMVLAGTYTPYLALQYLTGGLRNPNAVFPYGIADPEGFFRNLALLAHAVSLVMALGILFTVHGIAKTVFTPRAAAWSALLTALLAPLAYYGKTSNLDVPYLFWTLLAVWQYLRIVHTQRLRNYAAFGACVALAVATKDQAYGFFVLTPIVLAVALARHRTAGRPSFGSVAAALVGKPLLLTGAVTAVTFAVANNLLFGGWDGFLRHIHFMQQFLQENLLTENPERRTIGAQLSLAWQSFVLLGQMFGYVTFALAAGGIGVALRRRQWLALSLLLFPLGYYLAVLSAAGVVTSRYLLGPALLLLPFAGAALDRLLEGHRPLRRAGLVFGLVALAWQLLLSVNLNLTLLHDSRYAMEAWIRRNVAPGAIIESQIQQRYLPRLADVYRLVVAGNSMNVITYDVLPTELTPEALRARNPDYVLVLKGIGITGDPDRMQRPQLQRYYAELLTGALGYRVLAQFDTPSFLPYRQVTAGTQPTAILLARAK